MKCPLKNKECRPSRIYKTNKKNFICSGVSKKPTYYDEDTVWICGIGAISKFNLEMTLEEARNFVSCLQESITKKAFEILGDEKVYCRTCQKKVSRKSTISGECPQCQEEWIKKDDKRAREYFNEWETQEKYWESI